MKEIVFIILGIINIFVNVFLFVLYIKWKITTYATYLYCYKNGIELPSDKIGKYGSEIILKYIFKRKERRK
jgi:hypothetical protein